MLKRRLFCILLMVALSWMTAEGLLQGSGGKLLPTWTASRIETAVILQRYTAHDA